MYAKTTRQLNKIAAVFVVFKVAKGISDDIMLTEGFADLNIRPKLNAFVVCDNGQKIQEKLDTDVATGK